MTCRLQFESTEFSGNHSLSLHDAADPGPPLCVLQAPLVPDQHRLVPEAAVPGRLAAAQVGGGRRRLQVLLLLLPDQQGRLPVPQPGKALRQGLLCQGGTAMTRWTRRAKRNRRTRARRTTFLCSRLLLYSSCVTVQHVGGVSVVTGETSRSRPAQPSVDRLRSRSISAVHLILQQNLLEQNQVREL